MRCLVIVKQFSPVWGRISLASAILFRHWLLPSFCFVRLADREAFRRRRSLLLRPCFHPHWFSLTVGEVVLVGVRLLAVGAAIYIAASRAWSHPAVTGTRRLPTTLSVPIPYLCLSICS